MEIQAADSALRPVAFTPQPSVHAQAREAALACGYHLSGHHLRTQIDLDKAPSAPVWLEGSPCEPCTLVQTPALCTPLSRRPLPNPAMYLSRSTSGKAL